MPETILESGTSARFGVRARLFLSFLGITGFAVFAVIAAVYALVKIGGAFDLITEKRVPGALIAQELSREAERLVAVGPAMLSSTSAEEQEQLSDEMYAIGDRVSELLEDLNKTGIEPESVKSIQNLTEAISLHAISLDGIFMNTISHRERKEFALVELSNAHDLIKETLSSRAKVEQEQILKLKKLLSERKSLGQNQTAGTSSAIFQLSEQILNPRPQFYCWTKRS